ncbi:CapA family protein [Paenibacillus oenotherae]|uniref:CapA family protein n=1 Tax=Paenibacillus oenotherae TaxID=1435645 RepID=A0ABS7DBL9_9BACL|nr:CapA family protein [Paenibacillus oenotherae]MBW7477006.1 CapA family protein [Paenibacillus oenotherae]
MFVSRSESRQQDKNRRSRRMRRLIIVNLSMLAVICILGAVLYGAYFKDDELDKVPNGGTDQLAEQETPDNSKTGNHDLPDGTLPPTDGNSEEIVPPDKENPPAEETPLPSRNGGGDGDGDDPAEPDNKPSPGDEGSAAGEPDGKTIKLSFVGDILLASSVEALMKSHGFDYPYAKALPYLTKPDLLAGNLENPITTRGVPALNKQYVFKGTPDSLPALKEAGFDVVNLANNHTLDQGVEGLLDTIGHLDEAGMPNMGGGNDETEAYKPVLLEANGISVAYVGLSRVLPVGEWKATDKRPGLAETYDSTRAVKTIKEAKGQADLVVVMVHWGIERADHPNADQKRLAREYIDAGADLVIGSHPHVLQGLEQYKGKWISYSLGNFIFNMTKTENTKDTGVLDAVCTVAGDCSLQFHPMRAVASQPTPLEGEQAKVLLERLSSLSINAQVDAEGYVKPKGK